MLRRSRTSFPMLPASVIVSAWNEIVATELKYSEPPAPIRNASAVGSAAKPYISASRPCGMPLTTTASAAKRSVSITKSLSHKERFWEKSLYFLTHYAVKVNTLSPQTRASPGENTPKKHPAARKLTNFIFMIR